MHLAGGILLGYDVLVVATGATLLPEETEGLTGPGWSENVFAGRWAVHRTARARCAAPS